MGDGLEARVYGYKDHPTFAENWWMWPVRLGQGQHTLSGLEDGQTYGIYALVEDAGGNALSWPSNLQKVKPFVATPHEVTLKREPITGYEIHDVSAYRLRISVESTTNVPKDIFLYQKEPATGLTAATKDSFVCVCSAADLEQFPVGQPQDGEPPFYRLDWIDVVEEELETVDQIWEDVNSAVRALEIQLADLDRIARYSRAVAHSGSDPEPSLSSVSLSYSSISLSSSSSFISSSSFSSSSEELQDSSSSSQESASLSQSSSSSVGAISSSSVSILSSSSSSV